MNYSDKLDQIHNEYQKKANKNLNTFITIVVVAMIVAIICIFTFNAAYAGWIAGTYLFFIFFNMGLFFKTSKELHSKFLEDIHNV